jgi:EAL and modified HD-GYP domain-containing signal transduction protein
MMARKINRGQRKILLAEKVETYEELEFAKSVGFTLFQGFFFCRPKVKHSKSIDTLKISKLMLLKYIADPDVSFYDLAKVIKRDVVLSYRLLKIVNSAYYGLKYSVTGILHALTILGLDEIRNGCRSCSQRDQGDQTQRTDRTALVRAYLWKSWRSI